MKKMILIIGIVGFLAMAVVSLRQIFMPQANQLSSQMTNDESGNEAMQVGEETSAMEDNDRVAPAGSRYLVYQDTALTEISGNRRVLFFYANWCPTCIPADRNFNANQDQIPEDVVVIRINYNDQETSADEKDLAKQYGITYQHTFVQIDENGQEVAKWNGGQIEELLSNLK